MKVSEPVSCILGTGKKYRYRYRQNLVPEKSIGIGIVKIWYRKKVSVSVLAKFGTGKKYHIGIEDIWYRKKVSVSVSLKIMGTVTLCLKSQLAEFNVCHNVGFNAIDV